MKLLKRYFKYYIEGMNKSYKELVFIAGRGAILEYFLISIFFF